MKRPGPTIWNDLLGLFYPNCCRLCGDVLTTGESQLCIRCITHLPRAGQHTPEGTNRVGGLLAWHGQVQDTFVFLQYVKGGDIQQLIHAFKYKGKKELAYVLGQLAAREAAHCGDMLQHVEAIVPVPITRIKQWKRGYNQAEWIARGIASVCHLPVVHCLKRSGKADTQTRRSVYERFLTMASPGVITVSDPGTCAGRHVLLVDDVMTTGATLGACMDALRGIPDIRLSILVLSIV